MNGTPTPGPWSVEAAAKNAIDDGVVEDGDVWIVGGPLDVVIATVHDNDTHDSTRSEVQATAALIAAAPDMREFIAQFIDWWEEAGSVFYGPGRMHEDDGLQSFADEAKQLLKPQLEAES